MESAEQACCGRFLALPRVSLRTRVGGGIQARAPKRSWGWMAKAQSTHVRELGKMVLEELVHKAREAELRVFCSLNLKQSFKLLSMLE